MFTVVTDRAAHVSRCSVSYPRGCFFYSLASHADGPIDWVRHYCCSSIDEINYILQSRATVSAAPELEHIVLPLILDVHR